MKKHQENVHKVVYTGITSVEKLATNVLSIARGVPIVAYALDVKMDFLEHTVRTHARHTVRTNAAIKTPDVVSKVVLKGITLMEAAA